LRLLKKSGAFLFMTEVGGAAGINQWRGKRKKHEAEDGSRKMATFESFKVMEMVLGSGRPIGGQFGAIG
jgi:hypothetical protein